MTRLLIHEWSSDMNLTLLAALIKLIYFVTSTLHSFSL